MNCPCTVDLCEASSFYSFCNCVIWVSLDFVKEICGICYLPCLLELCFTMSFTPDVKTPTRVHFSSKLFQYESEFNDDKDKNQSAKKKKVTASKIYALISISFVCCDSHILFLQSAMQFYCKIK